MERWKVLGLAGVVAVMAASLGAGGAVWASHRFSDVDDDHPFHDEIADIVDGCIAGGFADGTYRPDNPVSRQAMAAFLSRGLGQVEVADGATVMLPGNSTGTVTAPLTLATVDIDIPDPGTTCAQFVEVTGRASVDIPGLKANLCEAARCTVWLDLYEGADLLGSAEVVFAGDFDVDVATVNAVVAAAPGEHTYTLAARTWLLKADAGSAHDIRLIAETHPFSETAEFPD
jgi:hypothetical protein